MHNFDGDLKLIRRLAAQSNPPRAVTYNLQVMARLKLSDDELPEGWSAADWQAFLDTVDHDAGTTLQRGVFWQAGDRAECNRVEAALLLRYFPAHFEPLDEHSAALREALERGEP